MTKRGIGNLLVDNGQITSEELEKAQKESLKTGESICAVLSRLGLADEGQVKNALELEYGVSYVSLKKLNPIPEALALLPESLVRHYQTVPIKMEGNHLTLAMVSPSNQEAVQEFKERLPGWNIKVSVCNEEDFLEFLTRAFGSPVVDKNLSAFDTASSDFEPIVGLLEESQDDGQDQDMAIILLGNHILSTAISKGCSNIHVEPADNKVLVHYRKDGVLFGARKLPPTIMAPLIRRFKNMASITSSQKDVPLDGRLKVTIHEREYGFRMSIIPGDQGEHLVIWLD